MTHARIHSTLVCDRCRKEARAFEHLFVGIFEGRRSLICRHCFVTEDANWCWDHVFQMDLGLDRTPSFEARHHALTLSPDEFVSLCELVGATLEGHDGATGRFGEALQTVGLKLELLAGRDPTEVESETFDAGRARRLRRELCAKARRESALIRELQSDYQAEVRPTPVVVERSLLDEVRGQLERAKSMIEWADDEEWSSGFSLDDEEMHASAQRWTSKSQDLLARLAKETGHG